jgi:hypothetical protein
MQYNIDNYFDIDNKFKELNSSEKLIENNNLTLFSNNTDILNNNDINNDFDLEINTLNNKNNIDNFILKKKKLIEISKNLSKIEYYEIFNIIKHDNCQYSENKNGIFINLSNVSELTIDKIFNFINFIKHKKEDMVKHEEIINYAKKNISEINKNIEKNIININNLNEKKSELSDSDNEDIKSSNYLIFSSDEDDDLENKLSLKKKKIKYTGKKAKMIKSIKDGNDVNKIKSRNKKNID